MRRLPQIAPTRKQGSSDQPASSAATSAHPTAVYRMPVGDQVHLPVGLAGEAVEEVDEHCRGEPAGEHREPQPPRKARANMMFPQPFPIDPHDRGLPDRAQLRPGGAVSDRSPHWSAHAITAPSVRARATIAGYWLSSQSVTCAWSCRYDRRSGRCGENTSSFQVTEGAGLPRRSFITARVPVPPVLFPRTRSRISPPTRVKPLCGGTPVGFSIAERTPSSALPSCRHRRGYSRGRGE